MPGVDAGETGPLGADARPLSARTSDEGQSETVAEAEAESEAKAVLPPFDPFSPLSFGSKEEGRLKVRLARLQFEAQERAQARQAEMDLRLEIRRLEIEAEKEVKLRQLELDTLKLTPTAAAQPARADVSFVAPVVDPSTTFDVSKHIALVPPFRETE
ncbi:hypothetical protein M9458_035381, partial [Cirrhinus mrigala]